jgi:radical SAM protein with 4Fe4S-binding SPASM domain
MSYKTKEFQGMPARILGSFKRELKQLMAVPHYWIPYCFSKGKAFAPVGVDIELTFRCNLKCQICPQELYKQEKTNSGQLASLPEKSREITLSEIEVLVADLARMGVKLVTLTGGEPFLRSDILEIISYIKAKGLQCNILTNGMLIKPSHAVELVRVGVDTITFSIDGPQDIHDQIRGVNNSFSKVCHSIEAIQEQKAAQGSSKPALGINCTISSLNQDKFSQLIDTAKAYNIGLVNYAFLFFTQQEAIDKTQQLIPLKQAKPENQVLPDYLKQIDPLTLQTEIERCYAKAAEANVCSNFNPPLKQEEVKRYFFDDGYSYCTKCFLPWFSSRINPYGDVYPCSIDCKIGNIREHSFSQLWNSERYVHFRATLKDKGLFPKCLKCCSLTTKLWNYLP